MEWTVKLNGKPVFKSKSLKECSRYVNQNIKRTDDTRVSISRINGGV